MSEEKIIKANVNLEEADLIRFNKSLFYSRISTKIFVVVSILLLLYSAFMTIIKFLYTPTIPDAVVFIFIMSFVYLFLMPRLLSSSAKKLYKKNLFLQKPQIYTISENNIEITSENESVKISSDEISKILETKNDFEIFISKYQAYLIPKRCIDNKVDEFRDIIESSKFSSIFKQSK